MPHPLATNLRLLAPFGAEIEADLATPLDDEGQAVLRGLMATHKLLLFRNQHLSEDAQAGLMSALGPVLGAQGEYREISSDGNLGAGPLVYHSDLAFTEEPFRYLSLQALEVNDRQSWTSFAHGVAVLGRLPAPLRALVGECQARTVISLVQSRREVAFDNPDFLPQQLRPAVIAHPETGEPVLYISEMQTARIENMPQPESDALLAELFAHLYAPEAVYRHEWCNGDLLIWDNIALSHARCDLTGMQPRRLQRIAVAQKSFFDLCPQFALDDPRVAAWASGDKLRVS